jgi:hypothetical protein
MNASGNLKRPVSVEKLLGKKKPNKKTNKKLDKETQRKELDRLKEQFGFK